MRDTLSAPEVRRVRPAPGRRDTLPTSRPADRQRILNRLAELGSLDRLMREPGTLAAPNQGDAP